MTAAEPGARAARKLLVIGDVIFAGEPRQPAGAAQVAADQAEAASEVRLLSVVREGIECDALLAWLAERSISTSDIVPVTNPGAPLPPAMEAELMERLLDAFYWCDEVTLCDHGGGVLSPAMLMRLAALLERYPKPLGIQGEISADARRILATDA